MPSSMFERRAESLPETLAALPPTDVVVVRISEIFLKGQNRRQFFAALVRQTKRLVADLDEVVVEPMHLKIVVRHPPPLRLAVVERLARSFGVASMGLGATMPADLDVIAEAACRFVAATPAGASFKIESKRHDKGFPLTSDRISSQVGGRVETETGHPVDVHRPDCMIRIEIGREDQNEPSLVLGHVVPGPGGLPIGTAGTVGLLLSGGIDSPVAGWAAMRRGCRVVAIYFHSFPYTGDKTKEKVIELARHLAAWQEHVSVYVMHFTKVQKALRDHGRADLAVLLYRRMMMRAASRLTELEPLKALVTGENLGQVASQTLENLAVIEDAATLPVLRPLITMHKEEIVAQARRLGTYETSILPYDDCCSLFVPKHPATRARVGDLRQAENGLDVDALAAELVAGVEHIVVSRGA
ncbi:tRNA uracil 4-sulfurtransferase ThiI [Haliangium sp.]|uniref:tRNA uracil 4-sulfurtransferase ThiI n=1 Tax=Haliangium sp. TaxID=2663208 RepID=UPI003D129CD2